MDLQSQIPSLQTSPEHFDVENSTNYLHMKCQRYSVLFLATFSYHKLMNKRLRILFPFNDSFYCVDSTEAAINSNDVQKLEEDIKNAIKHNQNKIEYVKVLKSELKRYFEKVGKSDKIVHIDRMEKKYIECIKFSDFIDLTYGTHYETNISKLCDFQFLPHNDGFFICFPKFLGDGSIECSVPNEMANVMRFYKIY